jgi:hypothetical protein
VHREIIRGTILGPLKTIVSPSTTDPYVIYPKTPERSVLYARQTNVVFFHSINEDKFAERAPEFVTAIAKSDSCIGYVWGELQAPYLSDASKNMKLGKGGVMISGLRSREEHNRDVSKERAVKAYEARE